MRVRVLGCSGGIGADLRTTSLLIDDDILIDCGTGVGDLTIQEMTKLRHIYLSHSHLDHIVMLPLLIDTIFDHLQNQPIVVHCLPETYTVLTEPVFNWKVWPNFFELPSKTNRSHHLRRYLSRRATHRGDSRGPARRARGGVPHRQRFLGVGLQW